MAQLPDVAARGRSRDHQTGGVAVVRRARGGAAAQDAAAEVDVGRRELGHQPARHLAAEAPVEVSEVKKKVPPDLDDDFARDVGEDDLVKTIARAFCEMCKQNGFAENFDALTGAGLCDLAYTWTASVFSRPAPTPACT